MAGDIEAIADIATGGVLAGAVEPHGRTADRHDHGETACLDCATPLVGPHCHRCGQAGHVHRTVGGFVHEIVHGVFHFEGKFWRTLPLLVLRPGELTRRYIDGERTKFVSPVALFLFSVFLMFTVVSSATHLPDLNETGFADGLAKAGADIDRSAARLRDRERGLTEQRRAAAATGGNVAALDRRLADTRDELSRLAQAAQVIQLPAGTSPRIKAGVRAAATDSEVRKPSTREAARWFEARLDHARANPQLMLYKMKSAGYKYSWALIPLSLPFLWAMFFWRRRFGLYDHAVFATYSLSFMSLLVVLVTLATLSSSGITAGLAWTAFLLVPPIHMYKQLRRGCLLGRFSASWRTVALLAVVTITSTLFFLLLLYLGVTD